MNARLMSIRVNNNDKEIWLDLPATEKEINCLEIRDGYTITDSEYILLFENASINVLNYQAEGIVQLEGKHAYRGIDLDVLCEARKYFNDITNEEFSEKIENAKVVDIEEHREFPEVWEAEEVAAKYSELNKIDLSKYEPFYFEEIVVLVEK